MLSSTKIVFTKNGEWVKQLFGILAFLLFAFPASATTYYISYSAGSNTNNGTSEQTPWKSHPYMQNAAGCAGAPPSYSHSMGDRFIFKQGDSWPNACFVMTIQAGGASGNPDVYTFDPAWGAAGGMTGNTGQRVGAYQFTAGGSAIHGDDRYNHFIVVKASYLTLDGIEFTGMTWTGSGGPYGNELGIYLGTSTNVIVSDCYFHGWTHPGATVDALAWIVAFPGSPYGAGDRVTGNVFDGTSSGGAGISDSGAATYAIPLSDNNIVKNMSNGLLLGLNPVVYNNQIGPINRSFDETQHENCIEPIVMPNGLNSNVYIYNNIWHDCYAVGLLTQGAPVSAGTEKDYIWNNVVYAGSENFPTVLVEFDSQSTNNSKSEVHAWNNTIYAGSNRDCTRAINRGHGNFGVLELINNHCISGSGFITLEITGNTYANTTNLLMKISTAASQGYALSEMYAYSPTTGKRSTVGAGTNLTKLISGNTATLATDTTYAGMRLPISRRSGGPWDIGAYQYGGSPTAAPPTHLSMAIQ